MQIDVTIAIPIGLQHRDIAHRAVDSAKAQTVPAKWIAIVDSEGRGPGFIRNQALARADTRFIVFLDADDWLEPLFIEETLRAYQSGRYVFTDWYEDGIWKQAPRLQRNGETVSMPDKKPWCGSTWHGITSLLPVDALKQVGGFDEQMIAMEDTDLFLKLTKIGLCCGIRVPKPLYNYTKGGGRSQTFNDAPEAVKNEVFALITSRYGGKMGCCGDDSVQNSTPQGAQQPGDVLAQALWVGNRIERGRMTGRLYPRMSFPRTAWVSPADIQASPQLWKSLEIKVETIDEAQVLRGVEQIAEFMAPLMQPPNIYRPAAPPPENTAREVPNVSEIIEKAKQKLNQSAG